MLADELVRIFQARGRYPRWRAKCPVHKSRGLTLSLKAGKDRVSITCHAGCHSDEVLATKGLKWQDTQYVEQQRLDPQAYKEAKRKQQREEYERRQTRIKMWYWINDLRKWETVASLLHAHLVYARGSPEEQPISRLWRKSLSTARDRHSKLIPYWRNAPEVQMYHLTRIPREITAKFVGLEIAEVLGL